MATTSTTRHKVWLDCDPGHDDAIALLLALYLKESIEVVGISTVNGNAPLLKTHINCSQILTLYRAPTSIPLHRGLDRPLVKKAISPPTSIHGHSGLDGVVGLPPVTDPRVVAWHNQQHATLPTVLPALKSLLSSWNSGPEKKDKLTFVVTGPATNIGAFRRDNQKMFDDNVEQVVVMGGSFGINQWTPYAEFNVHVDPDALAILLASPVPVVLVPLNVTHQAIFTYATDRKLLDPSTTSTDADPTPAAVTPLRESLHTMLNFFRKAYQHSFGFEEGPPLHDALTILYLSHPHLITGRWAHLRVETAAGPRNGESVPDFCSPEGNTDRYEDRAKYAAVDGSLPNCLILEHLDVAGFFDVLLECVNRADAAIAAASPM